MKIARINPKTEYVRMFGGLDQSSPALSVSPGSLLACSNYEANTNGGYRRIDGYERYSGQASPSDAVYSLCVATGTVAVGNTIVGVTSGATGVVSKIYTGAFDITKVTGTFVAENYTVSGVATGAITSVTSQGAETVEEHAESLNAAADIYRADIAAPTGSGPIRGIEILKGTVYCFRDNAGGTAGLIYKATSSGWTSVSLYHQISFVSGVASIADGTTITQATSGATAVVKRTVLQSGAWGSTAAGRLIIGSITGTFDATHAIQVSGVTKMTASSLATQITILPGGRYKTVVNNFYASSDTLRIYGCDGVNKGFEFDGDVYVPIVTGMTTDTPDYCYAFKSQLFFSFKGSSQNSGVGTPYEWSALSGSLEIGAGDDITGYAQLGGDALGIFARNSSHQLIGNNVDDFVKSYISDEVGCIPHTVQRIGYVYCLDDRGVVRITPSDNYGNFDQNTISRLVQPTIDDIRAVVVDSTTYKSRNQYRLYGSDGTGVCMTILDRGVAFTQFRYPVNVACAKSGEDSTGKDVVFFGSDAGMVYQADKGSSFDGENILSYMVFPFNNSRSPALLKSYLNATLELSSTVYSFISFAVDFSYGDVDMKANDADQIAVQGGSGFWDVSNWDGFAYDSTYVASPSFPINGSGTNMNLVVYSDSDIDLGHTIDGIIIKYIPRRLI